MGTEVLHTTNAASRPPALRVRRVDRHRRHRDVLRGARQRTLSPAGRRNRMAAFPAAAHLVREHASPRYKLGYASSDSVARMALLTAALGILFLGGLFLAWHEMAAQGVLLATSGTSSFFYVLTALYAIFLAGGILAALMRATKAPDAEDRSTSALSIYWHFLTAAWICLYLLLSLRI